MTALTEVKLYGFMAKKYGETVTVPGTSMKQILNGLKFKFGHKFMQDIEVNNWHLINGKDIDKGKEMSESDLPLRLAERTIHLVPVIIGAAKRFAQIIVGIILIVASYYGAPTLQLGISLVVGGVLNLVFAPKLPGKMSGSDDEGNYIFNGAVNVTSQGGVKPLIFGRVQRAASVVISSDFSTDEVAQNVDTGTGSTDVDTTPTFTDLP